MIFISFFFYSTSVEGEEAEVIIEGTRPWILLRLPTLPEKLVKGFDLKQLSRQVLYPPPFPVLDVFMQRLCNIFIQWDKSSLHNSY